MSSVSNLQVHPMPRSRGSEVPQRQSPRGAMQVRTSSSDSDQSHHRSIIERSPKLGDRRSPKSIHSESPNQKKLGTRIADLESQLGQAQDELKTLKDQLASAEAAKKQAQEELEKKSKTTEIQEPNDSTIEEVSDVQVEKTTNEPPLEDLAKKNEEIDLLKAKLEEKEKALELIGKENEDLKKQTEEARSALSSAKNKEEETSLRLKQLGEELVESKANGVQLKEAVTTLQGAKEALEAEMKKLRVQTEQWRKAADAAAAILANGVDMNGRCGSMDKHFGGVFDTPSGGYNGFVGSPGMADDSDDGFGSGKRKGSGRRMFGDLWKKKSSLK